MSACRRAVALAGSLLVASMCLMSLAAGVSQARISPSSQSSHLPGFGSHNVGPDGVGRHARQRGPRDGAPPAKQRAIADRLAREAAGKAPVTRPAPGAPNVGSEITGFRTERSKTFATDGEGYVTRVFPVPVNFQAPDGSWDPIDTGLERAGSVFRNKADRSAVTLPARLADGPVRVALPGGGSIAMRLLGAKDAEASVQGSKARYADVLPETSLLYEVLPGGLKEALELDGPDAPSSFRFSLDLSAGLSARLQKDDSVQIVNAAGKEIFSLAAPTIYDDADPGSIGTPGPITAELERRGTAFEYTLKADETWLNDPKRDFPVVVDPPINVGGNQCTITGPPYEDYVGNCNRPESFVGTYNNYLIRSLQRYQVDSVPADHLVYGARLALKVTAQETQTPMNVSFHKLTNSWTYPQATWRHRSTGVPWGTLGGDFDANNPVASQTIDSLGWKYINMTALAQAWVDGSTPNHGVILKATNEPGGNDFTFPANGATDSAYLEIHHQARFGNRRASTTVDWKLNDRSSMNVNVANGNLMVQATDLNVAGTAGFDNAVTRTYNNLDPGYGSFGQSWVTGLGRYPYVFQRTTDSRYYVAPDGGFHTFIRNPNVSDAPSGFDTPSGLDATLCSFESPTNSTCPTRPSGIAHTLAFRNGTTFFFGTNNQLAYLTDQNDNKISFEHKPGGLALEKIVDTQNRWTTFTNDPAGTINSMYDHAANRTTSYVREPDGDLDTFTDAEGKTTNYDYDADHNLTKITDPRGNQTTITYDHVDRARTIIRGGHTTDVSYFSPGAPFVQHPTGCPTQTGGTPAYGQTRVTDPRGNVTYYCFDTHDRVYGTFDHTGKQREREFNNNDNVVKFTAPSGAVFDVGYDADDRPETAQAPQSAGGQVRAKNSLCYGDQQGCSQTGAPPFYPVRSTDPQGHDTGYEYDAEDNLTAINNTTGNVDLTPNPDGTLDKVSDARGKITDYDYTFGNLTKITPPAGGNPATGLGATVIKPDGAGRTIESTDGKAQKTESTYDKLDRLTRQDFSDGTSIVYSYDNNGNLTSRQDSAKGTSTYTYDAKNRLTSQQDPGTTTITYGYDPADNLTSVTDTAGTTSYSHDSLNRLTNLTEPGQATPITFTYDPDDRRLTTDYPNTVKITNTYDAAGHMLSTEAKKGSSSLSRFAYTYNQGTNDRDVRLTREHAGATTDYDYDALNRLIKAENIAGPTDKREYALDRAGNITQRIINGTVTSYTPNDANQLTGTGYSHDANGNQLTQPTPAGNVSYAYNSRDQLTSITPPGQAAIPLGYLGDGQAEPTQIGATPTLGNAPKLTNNILGIASETKPTGLLGADQTTHYTRDVNNTLLGQRTSTGRHYTISDGIGSVTALTDSNGNLVNSYKYDPYGQITSSTEAVPNSFGYAGGYRSPTGLIHFGERYYNPATGRWTQQDPVDQTGDLREGNRYSYVGGDPVSLVDPDGEVLISAGRLLYLGGRAALRNPTVRTKATSTLRKLSMRADDVATKLGRGAETAQDFLEKFNGPF